MKYLQCPKCKTEMRQINETEEEIAANPDNMNLNTAGWYKHGECCVRMRNLTLKQYNTEKALNDEGVRNQE